jgi:hypothetical protein
MVAVMIMVLVTGTGQFAVGHSAVELEVVGTGTSVTARGVLVELGSSVAVDETISMVEEQSAEAVDDDSLGAGTLVP